MIVSRGARVDQRREVRLRAAGVSKRLNPLLAPLRRTPGTASGAGTTTAVGTGAVGVTAGVVPKAGVAAEAGAATATEASDDGSGAEVRIEAGAGP